MYSMFFLYRDTSSLIDSFLFTPKINVYNFMKKKNKKNFKDTIILTVIFVLSLIFSYIAGRMSVKISNLEDYDIKQIDDINQKNCVINFTDVKGNEIFGEVKNRNVVILAKDKIFDIEPDGKFSLDISQLFGIDNFSEFEYVGSSRSKVFHKSNSKEGCVISDKTRVYFRTYEEAIESGYEPGKEILDDD